MAVALVQPAIICSLEPDEPGPATLPKIFRTAVVLQKSTKWEYEKEKNPRKTDAELFALLRARGEDIDKIKKNDAKQKAAVREIATRLKQKGIAVRCVFRNELAGLLDWADIVISAGGDGTFLAAAAAVANNKKPVIGINTDPIGSEGHLCIGGKNPPSDLIERLLSGNLRITQRSRLRATLLNKKLERGKSNLALNEVFIGEDEAARVSTYEISVDNTPMKKQKSSGLIVSTGTGSTSWYLGMNRVEDLNVLAILETMNSMGLSVDARQLRELSSEIAQKINDQIPFEPEHPSFAYSIREPIFNRTFERMPIRGFAQKMHLRSKCTKGYLVLDGATKIPFNSGTEVLLEIRPEDALLTYTLD